MIDSINDERDHRQNYLKLLAVLQSYAPNYKEQGLCAKLVNNMVLEGASNRDVVIMLCNSISDGLRHGNWPWKIMP